uniref:Reverse transcriptase domain-containing protein n=1 Tax=Tanacetum cinerariifolium TaxID=118510 RepID=A0A699H4U9_TANCI|nr:hypothetical protein [Tanacetum cinerariifolium]
MRDMVMKYKAKKVCHEKMVKMTLVDLKVLEVYTKSKGEHELHLKMNLELQKKEKYYVKPNKVKAKDDGWSYLVIMVVRPSTIWERRTKLLMHEAEIEESKMIGHELEQETTKTAWPIMVRRESEKTAWPIVVRHAYVKMAWPSVRLERT